jgi:gliding motility-associated-like protein
MRILLLSLLTSTLATFLWAQAPANDECANAIDLGSLSSCSSTIFSNAGATASDIGNNNAPSCFNGGTTQRDVWFTFTASASSLSIFVGSNDQANSGIRNPQVALYRGSCAGLSLLGCSSASFGSNDVQLGSSDLEPGSIYFLRINDYSVSAASNAGDFNICIFESTDPFVMGQDNSSNACFGILYDSGGAAGEYGNNENLTFTINPPVNNGCLEIRLIDYQIEDFDRLGNFGDELNFYAGENTSGTLIASVTSTSNGTNYTIQSPGPITVEFRSDDLLTFDGFELQWQCVPGACRGSSSDNPTAINSLPFSGSFSTCEGAATIAETPCLSDAFLNGPDYVFTYDSPGGICTEIAVSNAVQGTGVAVLDGPPTDPNTACIAQSVNGFIVSADMRTAGTYYILVGNMDGCTDFDLSVTETECIEPPSLSAALCNPLNGCESMDGMPQVVRFLDGFKDVNLADGVNNGCWVNDGDEADYYWFTIQAQADGAFGFLASSTTGVSDLDFNVWGPFDAEQVCTDNQAIIDFINDNQPIRSTWSSDSPMTGLVSAHPVTGEAVTDDYDCENTPSAEGDGFVRPIQASQGEVYVILLNDWGNEILNGEIAIDWSPSDDAVIAPILAPGMQDNVSICQGGSVELNVGYGLENITWRGDTESLSCTDCPNPVASPSETTTYTVVFDAPCYRDSAEVTVRVFELNELPDLTVCSGEVINVVAGVDFEGDADYLWDAPAGVTLSCLDCPDPTITTDNPGTYNISIALDAPGCPLERNFTLTVLSQEAPSYDIAGDLEICEGQSFSIGGTAVPGNTYSWTSRPASFFSSEANPSVSPTQTTTYFLEVTNGVCPVSSFDSVRVTVVSNPLVNVAEGGTFCQGDAVQLGDMTAETGVTYNWTGPGTFDDPSNPNAIGFPANSGLFTLTASRGNCVSTANVQVDVIPISVEIPLEDTTYLCLGTEVSFSANVEPEGATLRWTASTTPGDTLSNLETFTVTPTDSITYYAIVDNMGCQRVDSVLVVVDSLPPLAIEPADTTICSSTPVVLRTPAYEPSDYPDIVHLWTPSQGQETPDSLFNLVVTPTDTIEYMRMTTNNACRDSAVAVINVVIPPPISIIPADTLICLGESVDLSIVSEREVEEIMWMPEAEGGLSCTDCPNPTATPFMTTIYTVNGKIDDCPVSAQAAVEIANDPQFSFSGRTLICAGDSVKLNDINDPRVEYTWTSTDPNFGTVNEAGPVVKPTQTTTYFLSAVRTDVENCGPAEVELTIEVFEPDEPVLSADKNVACGDELIELSANYTSIAGERFLWTDDQGALNEQRLTVSVAPQMTTTYTFTLDRPGACPDFSGDITIERFELPEANLGPNQFICEGDAIRITSTPDNEDFSYSWTSNDPDFTGSADNSILVMPAQDASYTVEVSSHPSCPTATASVEVDVASLDPELTLTADKTVIRAEDPADERRVNLTADISPDVNPSDFIRWTAGGEVVAEGQTELTVSPLATTTYTLEYVSGGICSDTITASIQIIVIKVVVPNAFTPNNDGANDFFNFLDINSVEEIVEFKIFNRWGQKVYDNDTPETGWDGQFNGTPQPSDVYAYIIEVRFADGTTELLKGDVTLIR